MIKYKWANLHKHIPLDAIATAACSLRHATAIDRIVHLVVRGDDVRLIAVAINAEPTKHRQAGRQNGTEPSVVLDLFFCARPCTFSFFNLSFGPGFEVREPNRRVDLELANGSASGSYQINRFDSFRFHLAGAFESRRRFEGTREAAILATLLAARPAADRAD